MLLFILTLPHTSAPNRTKPSFNQTDRAWVACTPSSSAFDDRAAARGADGAATMVAKKKTSSVDNINARLSLVVKSGKISLGHRTTIKALRKSQGSPPTSSGRLRLPLRRAAAPVAPPVLRRAPAPARPLRSFADASLCRVRVMAARSQVGADCQQLPAGAPKAAPSRAAAQPAYSVRSLCWSSCGSLRLSTTACWRRSWWCRTTATTLTWGPRWDSFSEYPR